MTIEKLNSGCLPSNGAIMEMANWQNNISKGSIITNHAVTQLLPIWKNKI